jgi:hypothetical protein
MLRLQWREPCRAFTGFHSTNGKPSLWRRRLRVKLLDRTHRTTQSTHPVQSTKSADIRRVGVQCVADRWRGSLAWGSCWISSPLIVKILQFLSWSISVVWCGHISANLAELDRPRIEDKPIHSADKISCGFRLKQGPFKRCGATVSINKDLINRPGDLPLTNDVRKVRSEHCRACPFRLRSEIVIGILAETGCNSVSVSGIEGFDISPYDMLDTLSRAEFIRHGVLLLVLGRHQMIYIPSRHSCEKQEPGGEVCESRPGLPLPPSRGQGARE